MKNKQSCITIALLCLLFPAFCAAITIDGNFTDWTYADLVILDDFWGMTLGDTPSYEACYPIDNGQIPPGGDETYLFDDGFDDSRDLIAFYVHQGPENIFFRTDFFDLKYLAESSGGLDLYIMIDCKPSAGETWLPDYTDCQTDTPWDLAICVYDSQYFSVKEGIESQPEIETDLQYSFHAELDSVEISIPRTVLVEHGWNETSPFNLQVFTTKDGTQGGDGEIGLGEPGPGNSDVTDAFIDDDRGFSDGILNGSFTSDSSPQGRAKWAVIMHGNQSINNEVAIQSVIDKSKDTEEPIQGVGLYRALETAELTGMPVELHLSGTLTLAAQWADPEFNQRITQDYEAGLVDLVGGVFAENIMPFFHGEVNQQSIRIGTEVIEQIYGVPRNDLHVFWIPERIARGDFYQDILDANQRFGTQYQAVILDEITHHHDWFGYDNVWNDIEGDDSLVDTDNDVHKIHEYNGMKIFFLDRYAQKWKTETMYPTFYDCAYEASLQIGLRAKLLKLAMADDQEQLLLCMEDWEDFAGLPYQQQANARNPDGHEIVTQWIANHQWIQMTTTTSILKGEVDVDGDGNGDQWTTVTDTPLIDHLPPYYGLAMPPYWLNNTLPMDSYSWVRDSAEGNFGDDNPYPDPANVDNDPRNDDWDDGYQNWYHGSDHEFSFAATVPALKGWQYDQAEDGSYPAKPIPNQKSFNGLWKWENGQETPWSEGLIPEIWARFPQPTAQFPTLSYEFAFISFLSGLYETAWHDETTVQSITENATDDDTKAILVDWVLSACNHLRDVNIILNAIDWAQNADSSTQTISEMVDVDMDGENELVLRNNAVYLVFENDGGRLTKAYSHDASGEIIELVGASPANPDRGSEDENFDSFISIDPDYSINRVSCFREEEMINGEYLISTKSKGAVFYSPDLTIKREISLEDGSSELNVKYSVNNPMKVEFGFSPNPMKSMFQGKSSLEVIGHPHHTFMGLRNINGGSIYLKFGDTEFVHADDLDRGLTCALTQRVVIQVEDGDTFTLGFGETYRNESPEIVYATISPNPALSTAPTDLKFTAWISNAPQTVSLHYAGSQFNPLVPIYLMDMTYAGDSSPESEDISRFELTIPLPGNALPLDRYAFAISAESEFGKTEKAWPFLHVSSSTTAKSAHNDDFLDQYLLELSRHQDPSDAFPQSVSNSMLSSPQITGGTIHLDQVTSQGGKMQLYVIVQDPDGLSDIDRVKLMFYNIDLGIDFSDMGNGIYGLEYDWPAGIPTGEYILEVQAFDFAGNSSNLWPYWEVQ